MEEKKTMLSGIKPSGDLTLGSYLGGYVFGLGIVGIWLGVLADQISRFIFATVRFKAGKWTEIKI